VFRRCYNIIIITMIMALMPALCYAEQLHFSTKARSAIIMNADTGAIIYEKKAHKPEDPASITKVASALYALKNIDNLDVVLEGTQEAIGAISPAAKKHLKYTKPAYWLEFGSSHMGIKKGEKLHLRVLFQGMLLSSANDASNLIAQYVSGSIPTFMEELNIYLRDEIGCKNTTFHNPHGLYFPGHHTTAYDMALIAREAIKIPFFREVILMTKYQRPKTNMQKSTWMPAFNRLVKKKSEHYYPHAFGIKTGYTTDAQNTLVAAAEKDGRTLIAVVFHYDKRDKMFEDIIMMFETAFREKKIQKRLLKKGMQKASLKLKKSNRTLKVAIDSDVVFDSYPSEEQKLTALVHWNKDITLPVNKGQHVGNIHIVNERNETIQEVPLKAIHDVNIAWYNKLKSWL